MPRRAGRLMDMVHRTVPEVNSGTGNPMAAFVAVRNRSSSGMGFRQG